MALSLCSNWERMDHLSPDLSPFHQLQAELDSASLSLQEWLDLPQHQTDPFSDALDDFLYIDTDLKAPPTHFPSHSDPSVLSLPPDLYPDEFEFDLCPFPKRARSYNDIYFHSNPMLNDNHSDGSVIGDATNNYCVPEFLPEMELPVLPVGFSPTSTGCGVDPCLMYPVLASSYNACYESQDTNTGVLTFPGEGFSVGGAEKKNVGGGGCLSMQSVAARERRKRISEKTQELGRLIPGGNKMNTAEMFQGAYKYVKFLQAQVGVLGLLGSMGPDQVGLEGSPSVNGEQLQVLLGSLAIQEKLYHEEKCMVPKHLVESLAKDQEIKSKASISRDLAGFIESLG